MLNPDASGQRESYVIFQIAGREHCIPVSCIHSILNPLNDYSIESNIKIMGDSIISSDGEIPIIDFYELYFIKAPPQSGKTRIIIVNINNLKAAFFVDQIVEFISLISPVFSLVKNSSLIDPLLIKWQLEYHNRVIYLPDMEKILAEII